MLRYRLNKRGFSLLEVIIAIAILSVGITIVLQSFSFSSRVTGLSCDIIKAALLAKDKMQELEFKKGQNITIPGQDEGEEEKFSWAYTITDANLTNLSRLDFNITWQQLNRKEDLTLSTYFR